MILPIPILADYNLIRQQPQTIVDENNRKENLRRRFKDYHVGDEVLIINKDPKTLQEQSFGPFVIEQVHVLQISMNGLTSLASSPIIVDLEKRQTTLLDTSV
jgi:hypothetical protein